MCAVSLDASGNFTALETSKDTKENMGDSVFTLVPGATRIFPD